MEHLFNDHQDYHNQQKNNQTLCHEKVHSSLRLKESQCKLKQHDQNFQMEEKPLQNKYWGQKEKNPKEQDWENNSQGSSIRESTRSISFNK